MENTYFTGLIPDTRTEEEKAKDWDSREIYAMGSFDPKFREVKKGEWKKYQVRNQDGSGSCVANTIAKMLEVKYTMKLLAEAKGETPEETLKRAVKFSHAPIYTKRSNRPGTGMIGVNALELATKYSSCPEKDCPSENMNDEQLDSIQLPANFEDINNLVVSTNYSTCPVDFDYIAGMVSKEGCAMIWVNTDYQSWCKDIPTVGGKKNVVVHSITAVDTILYEGKEYIVIEDSWGKFGEFNGQRLISREFFKDAVWFAGILLDFKYDVTDEVFGPFKTVMEFGQASSEIERLQRLLQARGFFPAGQKCTGYYGAITARAVYLMQVQYGVDTLSELNALKGKRVGNKTLLKINSKLLTK